MKKIFTILSLVLSFATFGQSNNPAPIVIRTNGSTQPSDYKLEVKYNLNIPRYNDTTAANLALGNDSCGAMIFTYIGNYVWYRVCSPKKWALVGSGSGNTRDTVKVGYGLEVIWDSTGHQVLYADHPDGYEGGVVTYTGTGFNYLVSPITLFLDNRIFLFPAKSLTLSPPNSQPRYDIFYVDTLGAAVKMGDSADAPIQPQVGIDSFPLTQGFLMTPGDTVPSNISTTVIYDKNIEWVTGTQNAASTVDFNNTDNPYHSPKDILISKYRNGSSVYFVDGAYLRNTFNSSDVLSFAVYLNAPIPAANNIYLRLYDTSKLTTNLFQLTTDVGFYRNDTNVYQLVSIPLSKLTALRDHYTTMMLTFTGNDTSGVKGMHIDWVRLQSGIPNIIPGAYDSAFVRHSVTADSTGLITYRKDGSIVDTTEYLAAFGSPTLIQTNGVDNGDQSKLNLVAGTGTTLTDNGDGSVTIDATGSGGSQTWEQTLTNQGSTPFTTDNTVDFDGHSFEWSNLSLLSLETNDGGEFRSDLGLLPNSAGLESICDSTSSNITATAINGDEGSSAVIIKANKDNGNSYYHFIYVRPEYIELGGFVNTNQNTVVKILGLPQGSTSDSILSITTAGQVKKVVYPTGQLKSYTVATLPTGIQGMTAYVTDALTPTFGTTLVGGGSVVAKAFFDGTNWINE